MVRCVRRRSAGLDPRPDQPGPAGSPRGGPGSGGSAAQLPRVPVYLAGIVHRVERMGENLGRDRAWQTEVEQAIALYRDAGGPLPLELATPDRLVAARWMLEELRLSLFAQPLGARGPVSVQRVRRALA